MNVKLLVVQGRPAGKRLTFPNGEYYIGRGAECHIRSDSDWVSRQHALLRVTASTASLRDLGSRNGTLVNGALVDHELELRNGDLLQLGPLVFEVELEATGTQLDGQAEYQTTEVAVPETDESIRSSEDSTKQHPAWEPRGA
jgi:pSer/pThr/pTyr-binding forkhead associated (FHA) protein